jgi:hypothetical protein
MFFKVWVASPRPVPVTMAAAYVADADGLIAIGGAQAIGALAYGTGQTPKVCSNLLTSSFPAMTAVNSAMLSWAPEISGSQQPSRWSQACVPSIC